MGTIFKLVVIATILIHGSTMANATGGDDWEKWSQAELEKQMSPSRWNPNKSPDEVIKEYIDVSINDTNEARESVPNELNVSYGSKDTQKYDVYGTDLPSSATIFFWIHGGYWQEGSKEISGLLAPVLHENGLRNVVLGYTLAPNATLKEIEFEVLMALESVVTKYPDAKLIVGGHSAGGQLSAMLLHSTAASTKLCNQIIGFVLVSGVYDLRPLVPTYINDAVKLTRATAEDSSPLQIRRIRPEFSNRASNVHILVTVGEYDSPEFQRQAAAYQDLLHESFPNAELHRGSKDDHFSLVQNMVNPKGVFANFVKSLNTLTSEGNRKSGMSSFILGAMTIICLLAG